MTTLQSLIAECEHCTDPEKKHKLLNAISRSVVSFDFFDFPQKKGAPITAGTDGRPGDKETEQ